MILILIWNYLKYDFTQHCIQLYSPSRLPQKKLNNCTEKKEKTDKSVIRSILTIFTETQIGLFIWTVHKVHS